MPSDLPERRAPHGTGFVLAVVLALAAYGFAHLAADLWSLIR